MDSLHENYIDWVPKVFMIAKKAAASILDLYQAQEKRVKTTLKHDASPVTTADIRAHCLISKELSEFTPHIPVLSEEGAPVSFAKRSRWRRYWLVDPLDGTREFLARTGEFAVNIALIEDHDPVLGVVVVPLLQEVYWAVKGYAAYYQKGNKHPKRLRVRTKLRDFIRVAVSRREGGQKELSSFLESLRRLYPRQAEFTLIACGSALKICLVASGRADIYPRWGATGEWDTAAGQCILEAAGGILCDVAGKPLKYNTKSSVIHTGFLAVGSNKLYNLCCG